MFMFTLHIAKDLTKSGLICFTRYLPDKERAVILLSCILYDHPSFGDAPCVLNLEYKPLLIICILSFIISTTHIYIIIWLRCKNKLFFCWNFSFSETFLLLIEYISQMRNVQLTLEGDMELLCVTGVEDKLQPDVRTTLELLANAGIKVTQTLSLLLHVIFF